MMDTDYHTDHYAGEFLQVYEWERYSLLDKALLSYDLVRAIISPLDAEELADVSFYQPGVDWDEYAKHYRGVVLRLGQGIWEDTELQTNYTEAKKRGLLVGGYWFCDDRYSPAQQRDKLLSVTNGKTFELEVWFDWEKTYSGAFKGLGEVVALMQICEGKIVCKDIGMYTGYYWFVENSSPIANANHYAYLKNKPLWLAWYAAASVVKIPPPWTDYRLWQYGTPVISWWRPRPANIDMNRSRFTKDEFTAFYGGIPQPPPNGGTMAQGKITATAGLRLREDSTTESNILDTIPYNSVVTINFKRQVGDILWYNMTYNGMTGFSSSVYVQVTSGTVPDEPTIPPPAEGDIVVNAVFKADGTVTGTWTRT